MAAAELSAAVGAAFVVVDLSGPAAASPDAVERARAAAPAVSGLPVVIVGAGRDGVGGLPEPVAGLFDLVVADPEPVVSTVEASPQAAVTLVQVLRASLSLPVAAALVAESAAYSMLQSGPEFARWASGGRQAAAMAATRPVETGPAGTAGPPVLVERTDGRLRVTLNRPERHNAVNVALRERLVEALLVARTDPAIRFGRPRRRRAVVLQRRRPGRVRHPARSGHRPSRPAHPQPVTATGHDGPSSIRRLQDLLVVDFSSLWAGPLCTHLLGLAGARVVKVESRR